jgi:predicted transcriptional regulator
MLSILRKTCENCNPLTPITCVATCKTWRLKNQFRKLHEKTKNPDYMTRLLNTLKNKRRLQLLQMLSRERFSTVRLQQKLREHGFNHSRQTIVEMYLNPLLETGLVDESQNLLSATVFGSKLGELVKGLNDLGDVLPPHSECHEETTLDFLLEGPKTYEDLRTVVAPKSVARVLKRLQRAGLTETNSEKYYVFLFRTKRDSEKSELSSTEKRVYLQIPDGGVCARKLAARTGISLRRAYKYLRRLKGKKLVFARKNPISYTLTAKGVQIAITLEALRSLAVEAVTTSARLVNDAEIVHLSRDVSLERKGKKDEQIFPLTAIQNPERS